MMNWIKMHENNDITQCSRTGKVCYLADSVIESLRDEIIDAFGASDKFMLIHNARKDLELLECEMLHTGDKTLKIFIALKKKEIAEMLIGEEKKQDMYLAIVWLKRQGLNFDESNLTVFMYYKYVTVVSDDIRKQVSIQKMKKLSNGRK